MAQITEIKKTVWQAKTPQERLALKLVRILSAAGYKKTFIVGGYVRDTLLKRRETGAIDLATDANPSQVTKLLSRKGFYVIPTGLKHGTVTVHQGEKDIEITTFRKEGKYLDRRRPSKVSYIKDPQEDSARRDFTINSLYFDPLAKLIIDYQGGFKDLENRKLRFVGGAKDRIEEDALRLMRAVRFCTIFEFGLSPADLRMIKQKSKLIHDVSPERIKLELDKIMASLNRSDGIRLLLKIGLLKEILPEVEALNRTPQSKNYHSEGNVFVHTLLALKKLESGSDLRTAYGLLLHDIGKAPTAKPTRRGGRRHVAFYGHQPAGEELAKRLLKRLRASNHEIEDIVWYVKNHHVPFELKKMRASKQMKWCLDPRFENLLKIFRADSLASIPSDNRGRQIKPSLASYNFALKILHKARSQPVLQKKLVSGNDVIKILDLREGPLIGRLLSLIRDRQLSGKLKDRKQALKYLATLKEQPGN